jgi:Fe-S oxidoreductase
MSTTDTRTAPFDRQGDQPDEERLDAAMRSFATDFGAVAAIHMEACVNCGLCARACHFHLASGDPKHTPTYKLEPFRRAYLREASAFAPLIRALGLVKKPTVDDLQQWQELIYDSCSMCGRCTTVCPMGIDIAELVRAARHGMFKAGLVPERLALMDRTARQWGSPATPAEDLPDILADVAQEYGVEIPCDLPAADILVTAAPAELGEHTKALADAAKILNRVGVRWTMHQGGFDASNIGFNNGDVELQERLTRSLIDTALKIGAHTVLLPECGHAYGAARWEAARWYGGKLPLRVRAPGAPLSRCTTMARRRVARGRPVRSSTRLPATSSPATVWRDTAGQAGAGGGSRRLMASVLPKFERDVQGPSRVRSASGRRPRACPSPARAGPGRLAQLAGRGQALARQRVGGGGDHHHVVAQPGPHAQLGVGLRAFDETQVDVQAGHRGDDLAGVGDLQLHRAAGVGQLPAPPPGPAAAPRRWSGWRPRAAARGRHAAPGTAAAPRRRGPAARGLRQQPRPLSLSTRRPHRGEEHHLLHVRLPLRHPRAPCATARSATSRATPITR